MAFGRTKILTTFAFFGFFIGTASYFIFNWFVTNDLIRIMPLSILDILLSPWFISGVTGAILSTMIVVVFAHFSEKK